MRKFISPQLIKPARLLFSQLVALIPFRSFRQMLAIFPGGEFLNTVLYRDLGNQNGSRFLAFTIIYRAITVHFIAQ